MKVCITYEHIDPFVSKVFANKESAIDYYIERLAYLKSDPIWTDKAIREHAEKIGVEEFEVQE